MPSSLILGCSRCPRPIDWRANPDAETTDWRARRGKTAHRVRREGTAIAVSYPYPLAGQRPTADRLADSNVRLFGHLKGVVNFDTEVSDGTFQLSMTKQQLNGPQIFRTSINQ